MKRNAFEYHYLVNPQRATRFFQRHMALGQRDDDVIHFVAMPAGFGPGREICEQI